ncbi:MAG: peptidoglycan DD-metalloendopeptidase family protein [Oscillospiraceae bacterium]|nr:peptidoglycan DD-metalloendopeptidase family protein [Oscillospiraceae bacterium]
MRNNKTRVFAVALALLLVFALVFGFIYSVTIPAAGAASSLDALRQNSKSLAAEKKKIQEELSQVKQEKASAAKRKEALDKQIDITEQEIQNTEELIAMLTGEIARRQAELDEALRREAEQYEAFRVRMRTMEEAGDTGYLGVLLSADSFSDLLGRIGTVQEIMDYDLALMEDLQATRLVVEETKRALEADKDEQSSVKQTLSDRRAELASQSREQVQMLQELEKEETEYRKAIQEKEDAEKALQRQISSLMAELARKNTVYVGGEYTWPLPGYTAGSPYGLRYHPILKRNRLHTGQDIPAPTGTKILAANGGEIIKADYNSGYGNCVVIDHGGGQATLYGHMSRIGVSVGQKVKKGAVIGYVGSTGLSTGPHLHFEIIINGTQVNPMNYFTKVSG